MPDFLAKLCKKVWFPGVILKYTEKIQFQYSTFDTPFHGKNDNYVIFGKTVSQFSGRVSSSILSVSLGKKE